MEVKIEKLDNLGRGIAYLNNKICFIENTLPEEIVNIEITKEKSKYLEAKVINYLRISNKRIKEECPYSKECGGCSLNHMSYEDENLYKENLVKDLVEKYANLNRELVSSIIFHKRDNYRNKITLHGPILGLYKKNTNDTINIDKCLLVNDKINEIIKLLPKEGIEEVIIKTSNDNKQVMLSIKGNISNKEELLNSVDVLRINNKYLTNNKQIITNIGSKKYYESIDSFFQVNNTLTEKLYNEVLKIIKGKKYNNVLDLYCGCGTIGIYISDYCNKIIGIDNNKSNIEDASLNKDLNNCNNIEFICDKVENKINEFKNIDLVIVDPPRSGLDNKTKDYLKMINPKEIIYISCNPQTLSRDLKDLSISFNIGSIKPFNMFPRSNHVEAITVLERK